MSLSQQRKFIVVEGDEPLDIVTIARKKEHHDRVCMIGGWINLGHIKVSKFDDCGVHHGASFIRLLCEDQVFAEPASIFPSTRLVAMIALAINSGLSSNNLPDLPVMGGNTFEQVQIDQRSRWEQTQYAAELLEIGYHNVTKITGTVTA